MSLELESQLPEAEDLGETPTTYTGIIAYYRDDKTATQKTVTAGDQTAPKRLTHLYASKASAQRAVDREWGRLQNSQA